MRISIVTILALLSCSIANAQSIIDQVYKTINPEHERESYAFMAFDGQSKILAYGNGVSNVYDEKWNVLEKHNAGQAEIATDYIYLSRSSKYDSARKTYVTTEWEKSVSPYKKSKYTYFTTADSYMRFYNGESNKLYYTQGVNDRFVSRHSVSKFGDSYTGIAGQLSHVTHTYTALTTGYNIVDWDGNVLCKVELPYYLGSGGCQSLEAKDRTYIIVSAYSMYPKTVMSDCDLYSSTEYDLSSKEVEPGYYHYFIFEYDSKTNAIQMIKTDKSLSNRREVARYDANGVKLNSPQKGVNIILYSDGTSNKVIEK